MKHLLKATALAAMLAGSALAEGVTHHLAIHVDENDPQVMNMALNNAANVESHYREAGDEVVIEIVAYGPGLNMLIPGKSPVEQRIASMSLEIDNLTFSACGNTLRKMSEKAGKQVPLLEEAQVVPAGVVRLMELQEQGYAYLRP